jgi:hypothetical protein
MYPFTCATRMVQYKRIKKSIRVPVGFYQIDTLDGYIILLTIKIGIAPLDIQPHTDH